MIIFCWHFEAASGNQGLGLTQLDSFALLANKCQNEIRGAEGLLNSFALRCLSEDNPIPSADWKAVHVPVHKPTSHASFDKLDHETSVLGHVLVNLFSNTETIFWLFLEQEFRSLRLIGGEPYP